MNNFCFVKANGPSLLEFPATSENFHTATPLEVSLQHVFNQINGLMTLHVFVSRKGLAVLERSFHFVVSSIETSYYFTPQKSKLRLQWSTNITDVSLCSYAISSQTYNKQTASVDILRLV